MAALPSPSGGTSSQASKASIDFFDLPLDSSDDEVVEVQLSSVDTAINPSRGLEDYFGIQSLAADIGRGYMGGIGKRSLPRSKVLNAKRSRASLTSSTLIDTAPSPFLRSSASTPNISITLRYAPNLPRKRSIGFPDVANLEREISPNPSSCQEEEPSLEEETSGVEKDITVWMERWVIIDKKALIATVALEGTPPSLTHCDDPSNSEAMTLVGHLHKVKAQLPGYHLIWPPHITPSYWLSDEQLLSVRWISLQSKVERNSGRQRCGPCRTGRDRPAQIGHIKVACWTTPDKVGSCFCCRVMGKGPQCSHVENTSNPGYERMTAEAEVVLLEGIDGANRLLSHYALRVALLAEVRSQEEAKLRRGIKASFDPSAFRNVKKSGKEAKENAMKAKRYAAEANLKSAKDVAQLVWPQADNKDEADGVAQKMAELGVTIHECIDWATVAIDDLHCRMEELRTKEKWGSDRATLLSMIDKLCDWARNPEIGIQAVQEGLRTGKAAIKSARSGGGGKGGGVKVESASELDVEVEDEVENEGRDESEDEEDDEDEDDGDAVADEE